MIEFSCPSCGHGFRVPPEAAGQVGTCRKCTTKFRVPTPKPDPSSDGADEARKPFSVEEMREHLRNSLDGTVPRRLVNIGYQLSLLAVAFFMLLLPMLYVGVIAGTCFGLYFYCVDIMPALMETLPRGRGAVLGMGIYISPIVGGGIMVLFLIKPIFFTVVSGRAPRQRSISKAAEPVFFELVERICAATRSPIPRRIDVDYNVNASASLRRGLRSLFSRDLVLTVGTPLIAGFNTRQLAGVLAHEFGHFSQGGGMKSMFVIRSINLWFARVVYQRDAMDEGLDNAIRDSDWRISLFLLVGKLFVYLSRGVLWTFMMVAHAVSCLMMRQMEFDADRYEAHVAGSAYFAETSKRLQKLSLGQQAVYRVVIEELGQQGLITDLPGLIAEGADKVSAEDWKRSQKQIAEGESDLFATHPSDEKRIKAAQAQDAEGMFQLEVPARELFKNFDKLCEGTTMDFYRNELGIMLKPGQLQG
ncbi:MAG: M48 family metalloprotease [Planctomycetota bacterium]